MPQSLPELLYAMGTGRALCDWQRMALEPYKAGRYGGDVALMLLGDDSC